MESGWGYDTAVSNFMGGSGRKAFDATTRFDETIIDGVVNGAGSVVKESGTLLAKLQTGYVRSSAVGIAGGAVALVVYFLARTSF